MKATVPATDTILSQHMKTCAEMDHVWGRGHEQNRSESQKWEGILRTAFKNWVPSQAVSGAG